MTLATLGPKGSFSYEAATHYTDEGQILFASFYEVLQQVARGKLDAALYPIENSIGGFVTDAFQAMLETSDISIERMHHIIIQQHLITQADRLDKIEQIQSHPQALAQCKKYIRRDSFRVRAMSKDPKSTRDP